MSVIIWILIFIATMVILILLIQLEFYCNINFHNIWNPQYYHGDTFYYEKEWFDNDKIESVFKLVEKGREMSKNKRIVICGLARNISGLVMKNIHKYVFIGSKFKDYRIVCFENDSVDQTRNLLKKCAKENNKIILIDCSYLGSTDCKLKTKEGYQYGQLTSDRIGRMAFYREQYLNYVKKNLRDFDYMMVIDFDLDGNQCIDGLFNTIAQDSQWDAVFINGKIGIPGTLGTLTFTYDFMSYMGINDEFDEGRSKKGTKYLTCLINIFRLNALTRGTQLRPVKSSFNGCGIYKIISILNSSYIGNEICEHANLTKNILRQNGKIFINPIWYGYYDSAATGPGGPIEIIMNM